MCRLQVQTGASGAGRFRMRNCVQSRVKVSHAKLSAFSLGAAVSGFRMRNSR